MLFVVTHAENILILVPIALGTLLSEKSAMLIIKQKFAVDSPYRILVGCLWTTILIYLLIGLFRPYTTVNI